MEFNPAKLTVNPGSTSIIIANFTAPAIDPKGYPAYSGYIELTSPSETLRVAYLGVLGSVHEQQLLDHSKAATLNASLPCILQPDGKVQNTTANYTFAGEDFPTLALRYVALADAPAMNNKDAELV